MRFVVISDTHGQHRQLGPLPKGDVLIHAGDVSDVGREEEVREFLSWFAKQDYRYKIFIAGNHDYLFEKFPAKVPALLPNGVIYLQDSAVEIEGIPIYGSPYTPWFYDWAFNQRRGEEIKATWDKIPANTQLLITHGPMYSILDRNTTGEAIGCEELLKAVFRLNVEVHVCGHIHEAYGRVEKDGRLFINASVLDENYKLKNAPVVFDLERKEGRPKIF